MTPADLRKLLEIDTEGDCARCHSSICLRSGDEPTAVCDECAQAIVADALPALLDVVEAALAVKDVRGNRARAWEGLDDALAALDKVCACQRKGRP